MMKHLGLASAALAAFLLVPAVALAQQAQVQGVTQVDAHRLSDAFVNVAERVSPSVVQIDVTQREQASDSMTQLLGSSGGTTPIARGTGSGVVLHGRRRDPHEQPRRRGRAHDQRAPPRRAHLARAPRRARSRRPISPSIKVDANGLVPRELRRLRRRARRRVGRRDRLAVRPRLHVTTGVLSAKGRGGLGDERDRGLPADRREHQPGQLRRPARATSTGRCSASTR